MDVLLLGMDTALESLLPETENVSDEAGGLTQRPAVELSAAVERQIAVDALLAAQFAEELEGRQAGTFGGSAGASDADAAQRRMQAGAAMRRQLSIARREERRVAGDGLCLYALR